MKKNTLTLHAIAACLCLAHLPLEAQASWLGDEWRNFRTYPRLDRAYDLYKQKNYTATKPLLEEVIRIDPKLRNARILMAQTCANLGDVVCLEQQAKQWSQLNPSDALGPYLHAYAAYLNENWQAVAQYAQLSMGKKGLAPNHQQRAGRAWVHALLKLDRKPQAQATIAYLQKKRVPISANDLSNWQHQLKTLPTEEANNSQITAEPALIQAAASARAKASPSRPSQVFSPQFPFESQSEKERQVELSLWFDQLVKKRQFSELKTSVQQLKKRGLYNPQVEQILANQLQTKHCDQLLDLIPVATSAKASSSHSQLAAAYCANNIPMRAAEHFAAAQQIAREEGKRVPYQWLQAEADARLKANDIAGALARYDDLSQLNSDAKLSLHIANLALAHPELSQSDELLQRHAYALPAGQIELYRARNELKAQNWANAVEQYQQALAINESAAAWYELSQAYRHLGQIAEQGHALAKASSLAPTNAQFHAEYGYWLKKNQQGSAALTAFQTAYQLEPDRKELLPELGQLSSEQGDRALAAQYWRQAIDHQDQIQKNAQYDDKTARYNEFAWQREVQSNEDRWSFILAGQWRLDNMPNTELLTSPVQYAQYSSQINAVAAYRLDPIWDGQHPTYIYGRLYTGLAEHSLKPVNDGLMTGFGVSQRLLKDYNLIASAEWVYGQQDENRNDLMLRLSGSHSIDSDWNPVDQQWNTFNVYGDYAWLARAKTHYLTAKIEAGRHYKIKAVATKNTVEPYINTIFTTNNANADDMTVSRLDLGVGVALNFWHRGDQWRAPDLNQRLTLEWRQVIGGNTTERDALLLNWQLVH